LQIVQELQTLIWSSYLKETFRLNPKYFTRDRKQPFPDLIIFMLNLVRKSLQMELHIFKDILDKLGISRFYDHITKSAFVQNRKKVSPKVFKHLLHAMNQEFYTDNEEGVKLWNGLRVLAVDGSRYTLPIVDELIKIYGSIQNQYDTGVVHARASILYDVENKMIIDGYLVPFDQGERNLAIKHLDYCNHNDLIIYDRGYPSFDLVFEHLQRNINCLIRCKHDFSQAIANFVSSEKEEDIIKMTPIQSISIKGKAYNKNSCINVRLVKVVLETGEIEILLTTLLDREKYPIQIFKDLYYKRWGIEKNYDIQKNKIQVENFSGYSDISIQQDFYCSLFIGNLQSLLISELDEEVKERYGERKWDYKINENLSIGFLKSKIIELFLSKNPAVVLEDLKGLLINHVEPIRPNRKYIRDKEKFRKRKKPVILKNWKNNI
jgi:hypothetical protein